MGCAVVCAAGAGALDGVAAVVLAALGFAVAAALAAAVVSVLAGFAWVLTAAVFAVIPPAAWLLVRVYRHGPTVEVFRRHRRVPAALALPAGARQSALPAGSSLRALPAPKPALEGVVINKPAERIAR